MSVQRFANVRSQIKQVFIGIFHHLGENLNWVTLCFNPFSAGIALKELKNNNGHRPIK